MTDKVVSINPDGSDALRASNESVGLSTPYTMVPLFGEICYTNPEHPEYHGFCIEVRNNVTNRERRELQAQHKKIRDYSEWWISATDGDTHETWGEYDINDTPRLREFVLFSRYIRAWNARGYNDEGEIVDLAPPSQEPQTALDFLEPPLVDWLVNLINVGLAQGKGTKARAKELEAMHEAL